MTAAPLTPTHWPLRDGYHAVVLGAQGAIGAAWCAALRADPRCAAVAGLSRQSHPALELTDEAALRRCADHLAQQVTRHGPLHLVVDATGALRLNGRGPEKRLADLNAQALTDAMAVNAIGPALALQALEPLLARGERVVWAKLSARVGSIADNHKGGWYGYRASKAALNMLLQTAAIELARTRPLSVVAALQPGTVRSALSQPFVAAHADHLLEPADAVARLRAVLDTLPPTGRAHFVDHAGQVLPW